MNLDLTGIRAKLARSQEHAQTVRNEVSAWMNRYPYSVTTQANSDSTRYSIYLRVNEPPPLQRWTLIIADCINNLRIALDYLVYAVAVADTGQNPPCHEGSLQFPIADCRTNFDTAVIERKRLGNISDPVRAVFESLQPYNRPHPQLPPLLSVLRDLSNRDKHRMLSLACAAVAQGNIGFKGTTNQEDRNWRAIPYSGEVTDGTEIFAMVCDRPTPNMEYDRTIFDVIITIGHKKRSPCDPEWAARTDFSALLTELSAEVRFAIHSFAKIL